MQVADARVSVFCDQDLAMRIERAEAEFMASCAEGVDDLGVAPGFAMPIADGFATYSGPGAPFNKVSGLGFGVIPGVADLVAVEAAFAAEGAPVQVELSTLGDPAFGAALTERGYRLVAFENVLGRPVPGPVPSLRPSNVEVRRADGLESEWMNVVLDGVEQPDQEGVPAHEEFSRKTVERSVAAMVRSGARQYVALHDRRVVGGASFRVAGGLAQMTGAATAPSHRRRGVQTALLAARLEEAASVGCDFAVVTTEPASRSHANIQKIGFDLLYSRAILVKV